MRRKRVIEDLSETAKGLRYEVKRENSFRDVQNVPPQGWVENVPEVLPLGMKPGAWIGFFSGADMALAWLEGYHAATKYALLQLGEKVES